MATSSRGSQWIVAVMLALCIGGIAGWHWLFDAYGRADGLEAALIYSTEGGTRVIVLDRVSHHVNDMTRLNAWQPGEHSPRRRELVPRARMLTAGAQLFWLYSPEHGIHARDPATLAVLVDEAQLKQKNPQLAVGLMPPDRFELWKINAGRDEATGWLVVTAKDGRQFVINPASFEARPYSGGRWQPFLSFSGACAAEHLERTRARVELRGDGPRQQVTVTGHSVGEFLTPNRLDACGAERAPSADIVLLLHRGLLDEEAPSRLTAVSPEGRALWTAQLTGTSGWNWVRVLFSAVTAEDVILVVQGERSVLGGASYGLMTLDRADGRVRSAMKL